ncbi:MAG: L-serine ammonia-lyase, iron-sulfur-dependent, subunit alpha [Candidatus Lokiarchaeota archaeon]|nr:L-serine ammonia-lyase, iron-sulfur-dependent, subunit alpha [Candidatus Lokiarchaeota archaeon]
MFDTIAQLLDVARRQQKPLHEVILDDEVEYMGTPKEAVLARMQRSLDVMKLSLQRGLETDPVLPIKEAMHMAVKMATQPVFIGKDMKEAARWAMEIAEHNSGMGLIVAAPTAGSSGVLPATLFKAREQLGKDESDLLDALFVAAAVGAIIGNRATLSGSEAGCQAEVGVASAMAAAGIVHMAGGTATQVGHAIAITLTNIMGLICDPIAGLVISPCIQRNAMGTMNAFLGAEMALSGVESLIPADEVVDAMMKTGKKLPAELKETGLGGIADTPTGRRIKEDMLKKSAEGKGSGQ